MLCAFLERQSSQTRNEQTDIDKHNPLRTFLSFPSSTNFLRCPGTGGGTAAPRAGVLSGAGSVFWGPSRPGAWACGAGMTGVVKDEGVAASTGGVTREGPLAAGVTNPAEHSGGNLSKFERRS
jgi:hypothetical protein